MSTINGSISFVSQALIIVLISSGIAIFLTFVSEWLEEEGILKPIFLKAIDAFSFIAAAAMMGAVYLLISDIKSKARKIETRPLHEITLGDYVYIPKDYCEIIKKNP